MRKIYGAVFLIFCLAAVLAFGPACGGGSGGDKNAATEQNMAEAEAPGQTEAKTEHDVPDIDFGGYEFTVLDREGYDGLYWVSVDMYAEAENGEPINDAVFRRNARLEEKFNIKIKEIKKEPELLSFAQKSIMAGDEDFDVVYPIMQNAGAMIQKGLLVDLYGLPYLSFDKPWWNKVTNDSLTVGKKLYCAVGNIAVITNDATWSVLFNKEIAKNYELGDHYQLVKEGKWTLDAMHQNSREVTQDLNGDGILGLDDQWGAVNQHEGAYCLFAASGQTIIQKDADDFPALALDNDRTVSVLTKVVEFMSDNYAQTKAEDYIGKYPDIWAAVMNTFRENRSLYAIWPLRAVPDMRSMESDFGILPLPKYDGAQDKYYSVMQYNNATVMCVPVSAGNLERTGAILEAWAAESVDTLTKAYYEINLKGKYSRDDESSEMLDLILARRVAELGLFYNWAGMQDFFMGFSTRNTMDFASQYEKAESKWQAAIDKTIEQIVNPDN
ncbi:MAG: extracellular solute-binding protein [Oscillospiraceae bacterium]|nr:extracellular solute-binding protein [Oscillospiraceae bacterium]